MYITILKSKIHKAVITEININYDGSLTIDEELMEEVDLYPGEKILVANISNGQRFETYVIPGKRGSRIICLNGAAARLGSVGDLITIFSFCSIPVEDVKIHRPKCITMENSKIIRHIE